MKLFKKLKGLFLSQKLMFWLYLGMLVLPNIMMFFTESTGTLTRVVQIVLPLAIYWFAMTLNGKPGKMFWWLFLLIFIDAFQVVLLYLFGESPIAVDMFLNVTTTNVTEVDELLGNLIPAVAFVFVLYGGGIILSFVSIKNKEVLTSVFRKFQRKCAMCIMAIAVVLLGVNFFIDKNFVFQDDLFPFNGCYNFGLSVQRFVKGNNYLETAQKFTYNAHSERPDSISEVYVLVIGETVRATNMGICGYERNTTPGLSAMGSKIAVFKDAITMSNTTHKSVPLLLSPVASEKFDSLYTQRGIFTVFNEAGYKTAFLSNQARNHSFIDNLGSEAQDVVFAQDNTTVGNVLNDDVLLGLFNQRIKQYKGGKMFIVLHCYGSHFKYTDRYSDTERTFTPDEIPSAKAEHRPNIINAYDNTIVKTDKFLTEIMSRLDSLHVPSALIFTSDHGEDIFDDERGRFLHASPIPTYYQLHVPLVVWGSDAYRTQYAAKWETLQSNTCKSVSTSMVVFHTLLDLAGVKAKHYVPEHAVSNEAFKVTPRMYVNDHNEFRTMDNAGLKKLDVEQMSKRHMMYP